MAPQARVHGSRCSFYGVCMVVRLYLGVRGPGQPGRLVVQRMNNSNNNNYDNRFGGGIPHAAVLYLKEPTACTHLGNLRFGGVLEVP